MSTRKDLLIIDIYNLDTECVRQAELVYYWGVKLETAKKNQDESKANLDLIKAEKENSVREGPDKYKIVKVTVASVESVVVASKEYKEAYADFIEIRHEVGLLGVLLNALDQKRRSLQMLVALHGQKYFAEPLFKTEIDKQAIEEIKNEKRKRKTSISKN